MYLSKAGSISFCHEVDLYFMQDYSKISFYRGNNFANFTYEQITQGCPHICGLSGEMHNARVSERPHYGRFAARGC